jgi:predicted aspartyl protease
VKTRLLLALTLVAGCASHGPGMANMDQHRSKVLAPVEVPFRLVKNVPLVQARVAGQGPYWFLVDTGSSFTIVSPNTAALGRDLGEPNVEIFDGSGTYSSLNHAVSLSTVEVGDARFEDVFALTQDWSGLSATLGEEIHGILGTSLWHGLMLTVDYPEKMLTLNSGRLPPVDQDEILALTCRGPCHLSNPHIRLDVSNVKVDVVVDTGSAGGLSLPASVAKQLSLRGDPVLSHATMPSGSHAGQRARLAADVRLGGHTIHEPMVDYPRLPIMGGAIMRHFVVTFDFEGRAVRFTRKKGKSLIDLLP